MSRRLARVTAPALLGALLVLAGCSSPAADEPPPPPDGGGGSGGKASCPDRSGSGSCSVQRPGACADREVCTLPRSRSCGADRCCTLAFDCQPVVGQVPGGYRCETDEECASGVCLGVGGVGLCLRPCELTGGGTSCPEGLDCVLVSLSSAASVRACVGSEGGSLDPERALCANDADCAEGRYCRVTGGEGLGAGTAHGLCVPGSRTGETGLSCERDQQGLDPIRDYPATRSALCPEDGLCRKACDGSDPEVCGCPNAAAEGHCRGAICTQPCFADEECPDRLICRPPALLDMDLPDPDLGFWQCLMPNYISSDWGCFDETDCCRGGVQRFGRLCCNTKDGICAEPAPDVTHCRVELHGARFLSICQLPAGLGELGAPCTDPASCESGLCGPDGTCVSPCAAGIRDRCAEITPGSACCPFPVGEACIPGCRLDCATGPACP